jgi:hypothetical protein
LFLASFLSLFLELLLIRWVPSQVRVIAYYGNLMLLSSFLGLGCGVMLARREFRLGRFFAPLLCALVVAVAALKGVRFQQGPEELRFLFAPAARSTTLPVLTIFALNALLFLPLGELIGSYFSRSEPLRAYGWDIGGAIAGTSLYGMFSYFWFSCFRFCFYHGGISSFLRGSPAGYLERVLPFDRGVDIDLWFAKHRRLVAL